MITHEKLAIAAFVGSIVYIVSILLILQKNETIRVRIRLNITFIWTLAILAWPLIWYNTIDAEYRTLESIPCLLWPVIILGMDINNLMQNTYDNPMISSIQRDRCATTRMLPQNFHVCHHRLHCLCLACTTRAYQYDASYHD